ncbi:hypothetical protein DFH07DRAFT_752405, partial [Mycena maculata]
SWKDPARSEKLLALIAEDKFIKQSLYPPCGPNASTTNGGGKPKVEAQWQLAMLLLGEDEKYKASIEAAASNPKDRLGYANKIKNRLGVMAKITRGYDREMGETGAGIENAASIDMSKTNGFTTKWGTYLCSCLVPVS